MTIAGWIFMIVSWSVIIGLFVFCLKRTLSPRPNNNNNEPQPESQAEPSGPQQ